MTPWLRGRCCGRTLARPLWPLGEGCRCRGGIMRRCKMVPVGAAVLPWPHALSANAVAAGMMLWPHVDGGGERMPYFFVYPHFLILTTPLPPCQFVIRSRGRTLDRAGLPWPHADGGRGENAMADGRMPLQRRGCRWARYIHFLFIPFPYSHNPPLSIRYPQTARRDAMFYSLPLLPSQFVHCRSARKLAQSHFISPKT